MDEYLYLLERGKLSDYERSIVKKGRKLYPQLKKGDYPKLAKELQKLCKKYFPQKAKDPRPSAECSPADLVEIF